jgi:hypothetical protein
MDLDIPLKRTDMKISKMKICIVLLLAGMAVTGSVQSSNEWTMLLNNDNSAFKVKIANKEMTFCFDHAKDKLMQIFLSFTG